MGLKSMSIDERYDLAEKEFLKWKEIKGNRDKLQEEREKRKMELFGEFYYSEIKDNPEVLNQVLKKWTKGSVTKMTERYLVLGKNLK